MKRASYTSNLWLISNIKASSIYISKKGSVLLGGLQSSFSLFRNGSKATSAHNSVGCTEWSAPEIAEQSALYDQKSDIYSFGITAIEIVAGKTPFDNWPSTKVQFAH